MSQGGIDSFCKTMLHMDGADLGTTFTDDETSPKTYTANGGAVTSTSAQKFGTASGLFVSATSSYITTPDHADFNFGSGNFTIDFWINFVTLVGNGTFVNQYQSATEVMVILIDQTNRYIDIKSAGVTGGEIFVQPTGQNLSTGVWYHIAIIRGWGGNANQWVICLNGDPGNSILTDSSTYPDYSGPFEIGRSGESGGSRYVNAYIDEFRVSKGIARWTANFTPPAAPYDTGSTSSLNNTAMTGLWGGV